jgi:hypothetical protein
VKTGDDLGPAPGRPDDVLPQQGERRGRRSARRRLAHKRRTLDAADGKHVTRAKRPERGLLADAVMAEQHSIEDQGAECIPILEQLGGVECATRHAEHGNRHRRRGVPLVRGKGAGKVWLNFEQRYPRARVGHLAFGQA